MNTPTFSENHNKSIPNSDWATTRMLTQNKPEIINHPSAKINSVLSLPLKQNNSNSDQLPLVTVVTIVFNGAEHLEETILNVLHQTYNNLEYIVIDGGSTDRSLDIIRQYEQQIDYWVSEPDQGIADGMNKGISLATGDLIHHLHAGDLFDQPETIELVVQSYLENGWRWCYGNQKKINSEGKIVSWLYPAKFSPRVLKLGNTIPHSTVFSEKTLFEEVGGFDSRFKCAMDYHLWLRYAEVAEPQKIEQTLARFLVGGLSANEIFALQDEIRVRRDLLNQTPLQKAFDILVVILRYCKWKLNIRTFASKEEK